MSKRSSLKPSEDDVPVESKKKKEDKESDDDDDDSDFNYSEEEHVSNSNSSGEEVEVESGAAVASDDDDDDDGSDEGVKDEDDAGDSEPGDSEHNSDSDFERQLKAKPIVVNPVWQFEVKELQNAIKAVRKGMPASYASKKYGMSASVISQHAKNYPLKSKPKTAKAAKIEKKADSDSDD